MSDIPRELQDLLVREAHLRLGREQLVPVLAEKEAELKTVQGAKPAMLLFSAKEKRDAYLAQIAEIQETVRLLRTGIDQLDRVEPHVRKLLRDSIEDLLRASCPEYTAALAARQQKADWRRCLERFAERVYEFLQALGNARNMACTGYARATQAYSQSAVQAFVIAINAAQKVESEVLFANKIADTQAAMFQEAGFAGARPLPKLRVVSYAVWVSTIGSRSLTEAQMQFESLISDTKQLYESGIAELLGQAEAADQAQGSVIENFLESAWAQLREEITPLVNPDDTERSVADSEILVVSLAKQTALGRLTDAGPAATAVR
ncbi:MAG: hypothetical protein WCL04_04900 [Verrucomicrobiota bacterium]